MKRMILSLAFLGLLARPARAQIVDVKFIADTLVVQAEGTYATDPDLATLTFDVSSQEKDLKRAYDGATQSMRRIVALAERSGLKKEDVSTGVLTVAPSRTEETAGGRRDRISCGARSSSRCMISRRLVRSSMARWKMGLLIFAR